jgi:hypothetical protein
MSTLSDYTDALAGLVPGSHPLGAVDLLAARTQAVAKALDLHGKHRAVIVVEDLPGDGGFDYALDDLAEWAEGFSSVIRVEYPVDDTNAVSNVLDGDDWTLYQLPDGRVLRLLSDRPAVGRSLRVVYTARHAIDDTACTVADGDEQAVQSLAAAFYCRILAAAYALDTDSTISADTVNQGPRHRAFLDLSAKYRAEYNEHMGISTGKPKAAVSIRDQDVTYPGGGDRLTHPGRHR